ncbi:MAG: hypothetical protein KatS3mg127_1282 [Silanimonas sp.]|nr:MAG: hypothetical protein KatS3mg127_1282 [Silanimonas sp.]
MSARPDFSAVGSQDKRRGLSSGPSSNTGQKSAPKAKRGALSRALIDFLSVTFPKHAARIWTDQGDSEDRRRALGEFLDLPMLIHWLYAFDDDVRVQPLADHVWQFYPRSGYIVDGEGQVLGRYGQKDDGDFHVSLSGAGCARVQNWKRVARFIETVGAKITHVDIAVDDLEGEVFTFEDFVEHYKNGEFNEGGRNPQATLIDDMGSNKGRSLTIGQRGHKQVQIYEKGKQLGDPDSRRIRVEVRLYAKHMVLTPDVLLNPEPYFRGAYSLLVQYLDGVLARFDVMRATAEATFEAMESFLERQAGRSLGLLFDVLGRENIARYIELRLAREGRPSRFKTYHGDYETLVQSLRQQYQEHVHDSR